jgi:predicted deacylase
LRPHAIELQPPGLACWAKSASGVPYVHELASPLAGPEVLITSLVHGNEYSGAWALDALLQSGFRPKRGRLTLAFCNITAFQRFEPERPDASRFVDEDLNRVWSARRLAGTESGSELRRARELRFFVERASHLLDLHSMHEPCEPLLVTGTLPRNIAFGQSLGLGAQVIVDAGHADGVRMRDYAQFGDAAGSAIALLLEAGQHWQLASLRHARNALMRFLVGAALLDRTDVPPGWLLPDRPAPPPVTVTDRVVAGSEDFVFVQDFRGGETIRRAGTMIALDAGTPVLTPYDDCVLVMPSVRQLRAGVTTVRLGRRSP